MKDILETLHKAGIPELIIFGLIINFAIYFGSLGLYVVLSKLSGSKRMGEPQPILKSDIILSLVTVLCNTVVFIFGVLLWKYGFIILNENQQFLYVLLEVFLLTLIMDFLMYVFHRAVHFLRRFRKLHQRHHEHESTNLLSLFVLHPIESIGFGLMMLAVICIFPFSAVGISIYLLINSVWGTVGHLNHSVLPQSWLRVAEKGFLCTSEFHYLHHQSPGYNFGFYFSFWDVVFKTLHPSLKEKSAKNLY
jgi:sterol desaturase/sphingolipid hydroxylase (fatty acid hydroxylase superfamily)